MATNFDLLILGSGSTAFAAALTAQEHNGHRCGPRAKVPD